MYVEYSSNNSGGNWWLTDDHWFKLEKAGWKVDWIRDNKFYCGEVRWLGCLANSATRYDLNMQDAVEEWEWITGMSSTEPGCSCCGQPHYFTEYDDDGNYVSSGPSISYSASW